MPNAHIVCGGGGTFIHFGWTTVSTYAPVERFPLATLAVALGVPLIDIRPVSDVVALARLPRVIRVPSDEDTSVKTSAAVPLTTYLDLVEPFGAQILIDQRQHRNR